MSGGIIYRAGGTVRLVEGSTPPRRGGVTAGFNHVERRAQDDFAATFRVRKSFAHRGQVFLQSELVAGEDPVVREVLSARPELLEEAYRA
jgi:hypothetical protein